MVLEKPVLVGQPFLVSCLPSSNSIVFETFGQVCNHFQKVAGKQKPFSQIMTDRAFYPRF